MWRYSHCCHRRSNNRWSITTNCKNILFFWIHTPLAWLLLDGIRMHSTGLNAGGVAYMLWYVGQRIPHIQAVSGIRIRMFLGFPDPDPLEVQIRLRIPFCSYKCVERKSLKKGVGYIVGSGSGSGSISQGIRIRTKMSWIPNTACRPIYSPRRGITSRSMWSTTPLMYQVCHFLFIR